MSQLYVLLYDVVENYIERRAPFRDEHLALARELQSKGLLVMGGAFEGPVDGALLIFQVSDPGPIEDFVRRDPYVKNHLIRSWRIRKWNAVIGGEQVLHASPSLRDEHARSQQS